MYVKVLSGMLLLTLTACVSSPISLEYDELSSARHAIEHARSAKAERCAPKLLAMAESRLYWAAHELSEDNRTDKDEAAALITKAESYARQARVSAIKSCEEETTVILMPDEDGNVGALSLHAGGASQTVDQAFHASSVRGESSIPEPAVALDEAQVRKQFADILNAQPQKPARFILYFVSGSNTLTPESQNLIPQILKATKRRQPAEVFVVGHTDSTGSESVNMRISSARARAVEQLLKASDSVPDSIYLRFHGENDPLVPTPDNVAEPRNRRVEILVL